MGKRKPDAIEALARAAYERGNRVADPADWDLLVGPNCKRFYRGVARAILAKLGEMIELDADMAELLVGKCVRLRPRSRGHGGSGGAWIRATLVKVNRKRGTAMVHPKNHNNPVEIELRDIRPDVARIVASGGLGRRRRK